MLKIAYKNLGCKVNSYEINIIKEELSHFDFVEVDFNSKADIYVINTCSVTHVADRKSRQMINRSIENNQKAIIIVMGCSVDNIDNSSMKYDENIIFVKNEDKKNIKNLLIDYLNKHNILYKYYSQKNFLNNSIIDDNKHVRSFIKIEDGCNQFCSYCIIPYLRGRVKSIRKDEILNFIKKSINNGVVEVVLTGINISSYSLDFYNLNYEDKGAIDIASKEIISLIKDIYVIDGVKRIRLGSLEPRLINDYFIDSLYEIKDKFCAQFHLSLQSGCDKILKMMNRHYTTLDYYNATQIIRKKFDYSSITTDIIVGFPTETDNDFLETIDFCKKIKFYNPHIFKYSKREGTKAYVMKEQVPETIKNFRSEKLISITQDISNDIRKSYINKEVEVLIESIKKIDDNYVLNGFTKEYVDTKIRINNDSEVLNMLSKIINVKIISQEKDFLCGKII